MKKIKNTLLVLFATASVLQSNAQIDTKKGEIVTSFDYFDASFLQKHKIKTISVSYSAKKSMKPIIKNNVKQKHYDFDSLGRITRYYSISNYGKLEKIEWRKYKENRIHKVFKPENNKISVHTYYYDEGKKSIRINGVSSNSSANSKELSLIGYKEKDARYFSYVKKPEIGRKTIETKSFNKVIFLRNHQYFKDSLLVKEETRFRYFRHKNDSTIYKYNEERKLIEKTFHPSSSYDSFLYKFKYYLNGKIKSIAKFRKKNQKYIENQEFVYSEKTGYLQAIISQNKETNDMTITKYKYTFYK